MLWLCNLQFWFHGFTLSGLIYWLYWNYKPPLTAMYRSFYFQYSVKHSFKMSGSIYRFSHFYSFTPFLKWKNSLHFSIRRCFYSCRTNEQAHLIAEFIYLFWPYFCYGLQENNYFCPVTQRQIICYCCNRLIGQSPSKLRKHPDDIVGIHPAA